MAKKRAPKKPARKLAALPTKERAKKPAGRPPAKPVKAPAKVATARVATIGKPSAKPAKRPLSKSAGSAAKTISAQNNKPAAEPTKSPVQATTVESAATASSQPSEELAKPEHIWVVWQDGRGIWVGTQQDYKGSKRPETIICDVIKRGGFQNAAALHRAIQLGEMLRQTYATHMKSWLQYDDAAQRQRIQEWYDQLGDK